jgi:hypothetical protein
MRELVIRRPTDAAVSGRHPQKRELEAVRELGRRAAEQGVSAGQAVDLYLSAARRLWRELPMVVRTRDRDAVRTAAAAVLRVIDDAVEVLSTGTRRPAATWLAERKPCDERSSTIC